MKLNLLIIAGVLLSFAVFKSASLARMFHPGLRTGATITRQAECIPELETVDDLIAHLSAPPGDYTSHHFLPFLPARYCTFERSFTNIASMPNHRSAVWYTDQYAICVVYFADTRRVVLIRIEPMSPDA